MTLHTPVFTQPVAGDPTYPSGIPFTAQELRRNTQALLAVASYSIQQGVTILDGEYLVTQRGAGANFSVDVASGHAFVPGGDVSNQATYGCWNDGTVNVPTPSAPVSGTEVHRLVLQVEDKFNNGVWTGYTANLNLLADTGSGTPAQPASSITLALISISAGQASVLNANISDQRRSLGYDPWHPMTLINGWGQIGGNVPAAYRLTPMNEVEVIGTLSGGSASSPTFYTLPPFGLFPAHQQSFWVAATGSVAGNYYGQCDTSGNLTIQATAGGTYKTTLTFHGFIAVDA